MFFVLAALAVLVVVLWIVLTYARGAVDAAEERPERDRAEPPERSS